MNDIETVNEGVIEFRYSVRKGRHLDGPGEFWFDWVADNGEESDETFDSEEEAIADVTRRYS